MTMTAIDLESPYTITEGHRRRLHADGFIRLADVLSSETLAHYGARIDALVEQRNGHQPLAGRSTYGKAFLQVMNLWTQDAVARELVFSRRLARMAAELLGVSGVRLYHDQALYKEPGGGFTPWHTDQQVWPLADGRCCTAWIPFQAVPLEMGPLSFARASHFTDFGRYVGVVGEPTGIERTELDDESERVLTRSLRGVPHVVEPYDLGDVSFHLGWTFHRGGPNRTARMRGVMTIIYMAEDMRVKQPQTRNQRVDLEAWLPGVKPGEPAISPLNPLLYSAAAEARQAAGAR
jgi:ectoine hydroxylase-related dioxygenase (phytanoyl-CoA dioxygenase family)